jgi:hypothetical protein
MKYCSYCGASLMDSAVLFCAECGRKLPSGSKPPGNWKPPPPDAGRPPRRKRPAQRAASPHPGKRRPPLKPEPRKRPSPNRAPRVNRDDGYDGYYDDVKPVDNGYVRDRRDPELMKRVLLVAIGALILVLLSVLVMYML